MALQTLNHSPQAILQRLDVILNELLVLRKAVRARGQEEQQTDDLVDLLYFALYENRSLSLCNALLRTPVFITTAV